MFGSVTKVEKEGGRSGLSGYFELASYFGGRGHPVLCVSKLLPSLRSSILRQVPMYPFVLGNLFAGRYYVHTLLQVPTYLLGTYLPWCLRIAVDFGCSFLPT